MAKANFEMYVAIMMEIFCHADAYRGYLLHKRVAVRGFRDDGGHGSLTSQQGHTLHVTLRTYSTPMCLAINTNIIPELSAFFFLVPPCDLELALQDSAHLISRLSWRFSNSNMLNFDHIVFGCLGISGAVVGCYVQYKKVLNMVLLSSAMTLSGIVKAHIVSDAFFSKSYKFHLWCDEYNMCFLHFVILSPQQERLFLVGDTNSVQNVLNDE